MALYPKFNLEHAPEGYAEYIHANIPYHARLSVEEEIIILTPDAPQQDILHHNAGWDAHLNRCESLSGSVHKANVPIPHSFTTEGFTGTTPNHGSAILLSNGTHIFETQPLHRCGQGGIAVSQWGFGEHCIRTSDGIVGSHGGSRMSALGGTIRVGTLVPGGVLRHALKLVVYARTTLYYREDEADGKSGFRWPATAADSYADTETYGGLNPEVQMGSLLAIHPDYNIESLSTEPARIIAKALQNYGGYIVDDAAWDCAMFAIEWGPEGRVKDEFSDTWGYDFATMLNTASPWANDMADIFDNLHVVANNSLSAIGGGGTPRQPLAPPFSDFPCEPTPITAYLQVDSEPWLQQSSIQVNSGSSIVLGPLPIYGGLWSWSGPNGFSSTDREIGISDIGENQAGDYVATHTNACGEQSTETFTIVVESNTSSSLRFSSDQQYAILQGNILNLGESNLGWTVSLFNIGGRAVYKKEIETGAHRIGLHSLVPKGPYLLEVQEGKRQVLTARIMIME